MSAALKWELLFGSKRIQTSRRERMKTTQNKRSDSGSDVSRLLEVILGQTVDQTQIKTINHILGSMFLYNKAIWTQGLRPCWGPWQGSWSSRSKLCCKIPHAVLPVQAQGATDLKTSSLLPAPFVVSGAGLGVVLVLFGVSGDVLGSPGQKNTSYRWESNP